MNYGVIGVQRSGTTLLGLMLGSHPHLVHYDEEDDLNTFKSGAWKKNEGFKLTQYTQRPKMFKAKYPKLKLIHISRDPIQTLASMIKIGWVNQECAGAEFRLALENLKDGDFKNALKKLDKEAEYNQNILINVTVALIALKHGVVREYQRLKHPILSIMYEDLCLSPESTAKQICDFLEIDFSQDMLNHPKKFSNFELYGTLGNRPVDTASIFKHSDAFSIETSNVILQDYKCVRENYESYLEDLYGN